MLQVVTQCRSGGRRGSFLCSRCESDFGERNSWEAQLLPLIGMAATPQALWLKSNMQPLACEQLVRLNSEISEQPPDQTSAKGGLRCLDWCL